MRNNQTIHVFAICYNEEVLLPHFIEHYKNLGADKITILDNYSTDNSPKIIVDSGCQLVPYDSGGQIRDDIYLQIKNSVWKSVDTDFVIVCDIDEFLHLPIDLDLSNYDIIPAIGYDILGMPPNNQGVQNPMYNKTLMFRRNAVRETNYRTGAHTMSMMLIRPPRLSKNVPLLHYNHISEEYVYNRYLEYEKRLSGVNKLYGWGNHYENPKMEEIQKRFYLLRANLKMVFLQS